MTKLYGCHNRAPLRGEEFVPVGWVTVHSKYGRTKGTSPGYVTAVAHTQERVVKLRATGWKDQCNYDKQQSDPRCQGCKHIRGQTP